MNVRTLERCFNGKIEREKYNIFDTIEDRNKNAVLTHIDRVVLLNSNWQLGYYTRPLEETGPVSLQIQNVGNT